MMTIDLAYTGERNYVFYILEKSLYFAVYLQISATWCPHVRIRIDGILPRDLQQTVCPGSMPAIDCAATYGFGPGNAVTFGFLFGSFGTILGDHRLGSIQEPGIGHHRIRSSIL